MDQTAVSLAKDNKLKIMVCNLSVEWAILKCILTWKWWSVIN
jgi:uridylate kinase